MLRDEPQRDVARGAAHGWRRVQSSGQREQPGLVACGARDRCLEVLEVAQWQDDRRIGDTQRVHDRREARPEHVHDDRVLLAVLLARE